MHRFSDEDRKFYEELVEKLKEFVMETAGELQPKLIVLYGSFVRGDWHKGSDINLLVVSDNVPSNFKDRWDLLYMVIMDFPIEPHVYTTQEFEEMLTHGRMTVLDALIEEVMLYANKEFLKRTDEWIERGSLD